MNVNSLNDEVIILFRYSAITHVYHVFAPERRLSNNNRATNLRRHTFRSTILTLEPKENSYLYPAYKLGRGKSVNAAFCFEFHEVAIPGADELMVAEHKWVMIAEQGVKKYRKAPKRMGGLKDTGGK